jgi:xylulose-5-phosphate/fructose-6-phosphate phosphoketolase
MSASPYANGGLLLRPLNVPPIENYARPIDKPGQETYENTKVGPGPAASTCAASRSRVRRRRRSTWSSPTG